MSEAIVSSIRRFIVSLATTGFLVAVLLVSAGRLTYWPAWIYAAIGVLMNGLTRLTLRSAPELDRERAKPPAGAMSWDKALLGIGFLLTLATLVAAGLDAGRYSWRPRLAWEWSVVGVILSLAGMGLFLAAMRENRFFSAVVRIQSDRGHAVCDTGPYRVVRHPGNAGMILGTIGLPLLLLSAWSAIPALAFIASLVVRTHLEDTALAKELEGYRDYQRVTRYRLVPGLWWRRRSGFKLRRR